jgi:hypothetical protein
MSLVGIDLDVLGAGDTPRYQIRTRLDGTDYVLDFRFNSRREVWVMSITGLDGARILTGQTIVCGVELMRRAISGPPGRLFALSGNAGDFEPPGLTELGSRVNLVYITADDELLT